MGFTCLGMKALAKQFAIINQYTPYTRVGGGGVLALPSKR
jgi:hypothetical protein